MLQLSYTNGDKNLVLAPLKGQIDPEASQFTVGKVKVEIRLAKMNPGRWGELVGDTPDRMLTSNLTLPPSYPIFFPSPCQLSRPPPLHLLLQGCRDIRTGMASQPTF